jgi:hypothetical protein
MRPITGKATAALWRRLSRYATAAVVVAHGIRLDFEDTLHLPVKKQKGRLI